MANTILTDELYPDVRDAIRVGLTSVKLSDATIARGIYAGEAEREIKRLDPAWATRTGDDAARLEAASVYWCAALIVRAMPQLVMEWFGDYRRQMAPEDAGDKAEALMAQANRLLVQVVGVTETTDTRPTMFTVGRGRRGQ